MLITIEQVIQQGQNLDSWQVHGPPHDMRKVSTPTHNSLGKLFFKTSYFLPISVNNRKLVKRPYKMEEVGKILIETVQFNSIYVKPDMPTSGGYFYEQLNNLSYYFPVLPFYTPWKPTQPTHNVLRTSPNGPISVETSRTIIGPKQDVSGF